MSRLEFMQCSIFFITVCPIDVFRFNTNVCCCFFSNSRNRLLFKTEWTQWIIDRAVCPTIDKSQNSVKNIDSNYSVGLMWIRNDSLYVVIQCFYSILKNNKLFFDVVVVVVVVVQIEIFKFNQVISLLHYIDWCYFSLSICLFFSSLTKLGHSK